MKSGVLWHKCHKMRDSVSSVPWYHGWFSLHRISKHQNNQTLLFGNIRPFLSISSIFTEYNAAQRVAFEFRSTPIQFKLQLQSLYRSFCSNVSEPYSYLSPIPNKTLVEIHQEHQNDFACQTIWNSTFFPMSSVTINCTTNGLVLLPKFLTCIAQITNQKLSLSRLSFMTFHFNWQPLQTPRVSWVLVGFFYSI